MRWWHVPSSASPNTLPHRDIDPINTLNSHYFLAAEVMRENFEKLGRELKSRGRLSQRKQVDYRIYLCSWLGFLAVTSEGFSKLKPRLLLQDQRPKEFVELIPKSDALGKLMKQHADPLRRVRNSIFHLRDDAEALTTFMSAETMEWARNLHDGFKQFFSAYRVLCEVQYFLHDRLLESSLVSKRRRAELEAMNHPGST